jgi:uncharacterized membrane protein YbhN (UPF0104 family)
MLGVATLLAVIFLADPFLIDRFIDIFPWNISGGIGKVVFGAILLYVVCSLLPLGKIRVGATEIAYPGFTTTLMQILLGMAELLCATTIIYLVLPTENPCFLMVAGVFVVALSAAMISHSPGGLGVSELVFLAGLPDMAKTDVLAALLVFRLLYFVLPFLAALPVIALFELSTNNRPVR